MNVADVRTRVAAIAAVVADDERAHALEDQLHRDVLKVIAEHDCDDWPAQLAEEALKTRGLDFARWCA